MCQRPPVDPMGLPLAVVVGFVAASFLPPRAVAGWVVAILFCSLGVFVDIRPILRGVASAYRACAALIPWRLLSSRRGGDDEAGET